MSEAEGTPGGWPRRVNLADADTTAELGEDVAAILRAGDVVALAGGLGAGKTTLARALLRALADDAAMEVPSPTFTLAQHYPGRLPATHFDLFRLAGPDELAEIGLESALDEGVVLVEWPERAGDALPADALRIELAIAGAGRTAVLSGPDRWPARLGASLAVRGFLRAAGWPRAHRRHLQGDASTRTYERIASDGRRAVLMNAPQRPDGPPVRSGLPYSRIAHLAENVTPFVAVGEALRAAGFSAPEVLAADRESGLLLLEDLGSEPVVAAGAPIAERYRVAVELLAALHAEARPAALPLSGGGPYCLPRYDRTALGIEVELLLDWYAPHAIGARLAAAEGEFLAVWQALFDRLDHAETSWVLRDFHSPNLLWLPERDGIRRIGLLDYQDALIGPAAYDLASLLQDARVTVPPELERDLFDHYCACRAAERRFDRRAAAEAFAIMAAQRATKVLGIFARLNARDGKPGYLRHIPRLQDYLTRSFTHPVLSPLALWYETHLPFGNQ